MNKITKAIIPAAGFGTRFLPATKALPKEMFPIIDIPNIHYIVNEAVKAGIKDILIILNSQKQIIQDYFSNNPELDTRLRKDGKIQIADDLLQISHLANISYIIQDKPNGSGGAVLEAKEFANGEDIAVLYGDDLIDYDEKSAIGELIEAYEKSNGATLLGCQYILDEQLSLYGVVQPKERCDSKSFEVIGFVEKPKNRSEAPSNYASLGRYILPNDIFDILEKCQPNKSGEILLTDAIIESMKTHPCYACVFTGKRYDIGNKVGYIKALIDYSLKREDMREEILSYLQDKMSNNDK